MSIEIKWEEIELEINYVLTDGEERKYLLSKPDRLMGDIYVVDNNGEVNNFSCKKWTLHERPVVEETKPVYTQEDNKKRKSKLYGVGCREGVKTIDKNGKKTKCYSVWSGMLERCYSEKCQRKNPTYIGCTVSDEWLNLKNFSLWFNENYAQGLHLDKDIINEGNKIYSKENCRFVPREINNLFTGKRVDKGDCPQGVCKDRNAYAASISIKGTQLYLGSFKAPEEAFNKYKEVKERHVKDVADDYFKKGLICEEIHGALHSWVINLDTRTDFEKIKDKIICAFVIRNNLSNSHDDYIVNDDTQVGIEYALDYLDGIGIDFKGSK